MLAEPKENLKQLKLREDAIIADLGAGAGWYALAAAAIVPRGKVYALEVQKDLAEKIKNAALEEHLLNLESIWGNVEKIGGTKLANESIDVAIAANVMFQLEDRQTFAKEINRILKPGGMLLIIDWETMLPGGGATFNKASALDLFYSMGFLKDREIDAGTNHYGIIFKKPKKS
ncbi:hypothetical protein A2645_00765 [Candidatus Nomurabacteria bacterium RIFCSPHIGHO2_01_FULL_39_9]|uniref:Methyltransferase type 11 domain-containing protein n=1 Tax=Candidatus Nomurabacteria bacterium RIFCSPHIGHO2_01_FULL_39_9 TaxID=1801735 RepID=A0A1F6UV95_9BACT|nr:MAG: hypothetical protein A2645_00765 [Candidatus Nomurabacteria bacterium RIFCSPHIGHO2_01_FULL_39_9]